MSYILEALKKAEQSRLAVKLPDISSVTFSAEESKRPGVAFIYGLTFAGVVVFAAVLGWWLSSKSQDKPVLDKVAMAPPGQNDPAAAAARGESAAMSLKMATDLPRSVQPKQSSATVVSQAAAAPAPAAAVLPPTVAESAKPVGPAQQANDRKVLGRTKATETSSAAKADTLSPKGKASAPESAIAAVDKLPPQRLAEPAAVAAPQPSALPANAPPANVPQAKSTPGTRVWRLDELPPEIRRDLPKLVITGYIYSADPAGRVVSINERSLREGDELIAGLRLDQIAQDYVLFSFRGYRFRSDSF